MATTTTNLRSFSSFFREDEGGGGTPTNNVGGGQIADTKKGLRYGPQLRRKEPKGDNKVSTFAEHLEYLVEDRVEFLKQKYMDHIADVIVDQPGYANGAADFPDEYNDEERDLDWQYIVGIDPTRNKIYLQWICEMLIRRGVMWEDTIRLRDDLIVYDRVKPQLPVELRDINRIKSAQALFTAIEQYRQAVSQRELDRQEAERLRKETTVVYNGSHGKIVIPKTYEASKYWGRGTRWCTAYDTTDSYYNSYSRNGPLYIMITPDGKKYQAHIPSMQMMHANDDYVMIDQVTPELHYLMQVVRSKISTSEITTGITDHLIKYQHCAVVLLIPKLTNQQFASMMMRTVVDFEAACEFITTQGGNPLEVVNSLSANDIARLADSPEALRGLLRIGYNINKLIKGLSEQAVIEKIVQNMSWIDVFKDRVDDKMWLTFASEQYVKNPNQKYYSGSTILRHFVIKGITPSVAVVSKLSNNVIMHLMVPEGGSRATYENAPATTDKGDGPRKAIMHALTDDRVINMLMDDTVSGPSLARHMVLYGRKVPEKFVTILLKSINRMIAHLKKYNSLRDAAKADRFLSTPISYLHSSQFELIKDVFTDGIYYVDYDDLDHETTKTWRAFWWIEDHDELKSILGNVHQRIGQAFHHNLVNQIKPYINKPRALVLLGGENSRIMSWLRHFNVNPSKDIPELGRMYGRAYHLINDTLSGKGGRELLDKHGCNVHDIGQIMKVVMDDLVRT